MVRSVDLCGTDVPITEARRIPLLGLIDSWALQVSRLLEESHRETYPEDSWGAHDLIGALHTRDRVKAALEPFGDEMLPTVVAIDSLFKSFTTIDSEALRMFDPAVPTEPWWWHRVPQQGLIARDLAQLRKTASQP
jgi:hypothetical protein